jgi:hypothetical protein
VNDSAEGCGVTLATNVGVVASGVAVGVGGKVGVNDGSMEVTVGGRAVAVKVEVGDMEVGVKVGVEGENGRKKLRQETMRKRMNIIIKKRRMHIL